MAHNSFKVTKMARILAIVHIIVGLLLIGLGIAVYTVPYTGWEFFGFGIWIGVLVCVGGCLGIPGTRKERSTSRNAFASVFMGFSIASAVGAGTMIICYGIGFAQLREIYPYVNERYQFHENIDAQMTLMPTVVGFGIVVFAIEIWAAVCLCMMKPCTCCCETTPQQGQVAYTANTRYNTGHVMSLITGDVPVVTPKEAGGGMVAVETVTPGTQGGQPQMVMVPVLGFEGYQPYLAQAAPSGAMDAYYQPQLAQAAPAGAMDTGYQPLQVDMPPPYELNDSYDYNVML
ncbi:hypothetical protein ACROYT_G029903 [Oculina patagonica]